MSRLRHELPAHRKRGGKCADGGEPKKADGNPFVLAEAGKAKNIGMIAGEKAKHRPDRMRRASGGKVHSDEKEDRAMIHKMVKPSALERKHGGKVGADGSPYSANSSGSPYSAAGRGLRHGGRCK